MNVEQRLLRAFERADRIEPSADLWNRVVHSIEEDRAHRRRVLVSSGAVVVALATLIAVGAASLSSTGGGRHVPRSTLEGLELAGLVLTVVTIGPAIRRFGRNYAGDLWPAGSAVPRSLIRLLDAAYYLVFAGYILMTIEFSPEHPELLVAQIAEAAIRLGGLLLLMGVLHAATLVALPVVALIDNSTRRGRRLPRWMRVGAIVIAIWVAIELVGLAVGLLLVGLS